ncbi:hypothetical protein GCM10027448_05210 [Nocardioides dilutus]
MVHPRVAPRNGSARAVSWWGRAWVRAVEESAYSSADLRVGRRISRSGQVGQIMVEPGRFVASVEDARGLWTVAGTLPVLDEAASAALVETVAAEAGRIGALLSGDLPHTLVEHAEEAGVEVLPFGSELGSDCTCGAWTQPCPHALAVLYQLTWLLEADPFVLIHLRGLPRDDLLSRLHQQTPAPVEDLEDPDLEIAEDAALRAARALALLAQDPAARVEHLL